MPHQGPKIEEHTLQEFTLASGQGERLHRVWLDWLIEEIPKLFEAERCAIFVPSSDNESMIAAHGTSLDPKVKILAPKDSYAFQSFSRRCLLTVQDMQGHQPSQEAMVKTGFVTQNLICIPMTTSKLHEPFAVLEILNSNLPFDALNLKRLMNTAQAVSYTFENHEAQENMLKAVDNIELQRKSKTTVITNSTIMRQRLTQLRAIAKTPAWVLIRGENGTGKELFTELLHEASSEDQSTNGSQPMVSINCAALPEHLLESELFGFEKGAFTGAIHSKQGLFESAQGGTLFLDEIGELPVTLQPKLLRALETRRARRLGGTKEYEFDFRLISATHRNLEHAISEGTFRQDLYYRLFSIEIMIPSLRERPEDIDLLAHHFLRMTARAWGKTVPGFASDTLELLRQHAWPGNVRELRREVERLVTLAPEGEPLASHLLSNRIDSVLKEPSQPHSPQHDADDATGPLKMRVRNFERAVIEDTLKRVNHNKEEAARLLNISKQTLYNKLT